MTTEQAVNMFNKNIIRKFEDFDGMENGFGLRISVISEKDLYLQDKKMINENVMYLHFGEKTIRTLKLMGFEFDWKPKRTLEEVFKEKPGRPYDFGGANYNICKSETGEYEIDYSECVEVIGAKYYDYEEANNICIELNK